MAQSDLYARTFARAAEILGGPQALADAIRVPIATLESWFVGEAIAPVEYFHRAVEIVLAHGLQVRGAGATADDKPSA
jgi:hypothetical protein